MPDTEAVLTSDLVLATKGEASFEVVLGNEDGLTSGIVPNAELGADTPLVGSSDSVCGTTLALSESGEVVPPDGGGDTVPEGDCSSGDRSKMSLSQGLMRRGRFFSRDTAEVEGAMSSRSRLSIAMVVLLLTLPPFGRRGLFQSRLE